MPLVAGIDSSTQSIKILVCEAETGRVVREASAAHPDVTEVDPNVWWDALARAAAGGLLEDVSAIGVAAQQHGLVALDAAGAVLRPALLWNDTRSAGAADKLVDELAGDGGGAGDRADAGGGSAAWARAVGSVPVASFTVTKLRWMADQEPDLAASVASVALPHDWLSWRLRGGGPDVAQGAAGRAELVTDRGDASGTGYWSPAEGAYRPDLLQRAFGRIPEMPRVAEPGEAVGLTTGGAGSPVPDGLVVSAGTGDNMGAALGLGVGPGDVVVSLGTSGTVFGVHDRAVADASGMVAGFADATGRYLPLVCTLNAARVLTSAAQMLGVNAETLAELALRSEPGAGGLTLLPYLDGERTPNLPDACGTLTGLRRDTMMPENVARAAVEGMLCGLADGLDALRSQGLSPRRVLLIGGAARSPAVRAVAPMVFGVPIQIPEPAEYVALGAARQAAWALSGAAEPPQWPVGAIATERTRLDSLTSEDERSGHRVRAQYAAARDQIHGAPG